MPCILSAVVSTFSANRIGVCMNPNDLALVKSGVILLIAGMGMTFIFLIIQIICTNISSKVSAKFAHLIQEPEPKKPAKDKQTYAGMNVKFMLDYAAAVGEASFRADMVKVRDFTKNNGGSVYPIVKRMFLEHYAPEADRRFAYTAAKAIVRKFRYEGIITAATTHTVPANDADEGENFAPAA